MGTIETDQGPGLLVTFFFANGQVSIVFDPDSASSIADEMAGHVTKIRSDIHIFKNNGNGGGLILP